MIWWVIGGIYTLFFIFAVRPLAGHFAYKAALKYPAQDGEPDSEDRTGAWTLAVFVLLGLPLALIWFGAAKLTTLSPVIGAEKAFLAKRKAEEEKRKLKEAEIELGLR